MRRDTRSPIYVFAECVCGGVFQDDAPVDWESVDFWTRIGHSGTGHEVQALLEPRRVLEWRDGGMKPVRAGG